MGCDMCGVEDQLFKTEVEGSILNVCEQCGKYGKVISRIKTEEEIKHEEKRRIRFEKEKKEEPVEMVVENYASLIKNSREKMNLKQEDLAKKINEKESLIHHIESGKTEPSIKLAKKLERFLRIKLIEFEILDFTPEKHESSAGLTIGDLIKVKNK